YELGRAADSSDAEAVLISGTGLPTVGIVERLERDLGKPVVTSQVATLWQALRVVGVTEPVLGYGRLLSAAGLVRAALPSGASSSRSKNGSALDGSPART